MLANATILFASLYILAYGPNCISDLPAHFLSQKTSWHLHISKWNAEGHSTPFETKLLSCGFSAGQCWALLQAAVTRMKRQSGQKLLQSALEVVLSPTMCTVVQMLPI